MLFHWAAVIDDGVQAVDAYASRAAAGKLVHERGGPIAAERGLATREIRE